VAISSQNSSHQAYGVRQRSWLERSLDPLVVLINMYKNSYGTVPILVSMFGECSEE
jgi:hypothetical protein